MKDTDNIAGISSVLGGIISIVSYARTDVMHDNWQGMIAAAIVGGLTAAAGGLVYSVVAHALEEIPVTPRRVLAMTAWGVAAMKGYDFSSHAVPDVLYRHNRPPVLEDFVQQSQKGLPSDTLAIDNFKPVQQGFVQNMASVKQLYTAADLATEHFFTTKMPALV